MKIDLRQEFFDIMEELAEKDKDIIVIVGDLGFSKMEKYQKRFPEQFLNAGCIEQSMVGISTGMSLMGKKPYVYSGTIFLLMRAYEQIRDDICYNNTNVKLIGTGASPFLGFSHNLQGMENEEDLLKNLPNIKRFYPQNKEELKEALLVEGPVFIKI